MRWIFNRKKCGAAIYFFFLLENSSITDFPSIILYCNFVYRHWRFVFNAITPLNNIGQLRKLGVTFLNALLIPQHELPGVFANAPYNSTVNGSLWTLPVEFLCYIACFIFYKTGFLRKGKFCLTIPLAVITTLFSFYVSDKIPTLFTALSPCLFFYIGMTYYVYHDKIILNKKYFLMSVCLFVLFSVFHLHRLGMFLCFPYIMFTFWFGARQLPRKLAYIGNFSYGIYLFGISGSTDNYLSF